jgi:3-oxoacyl-[acyl-carrier protein] reductase
MASLKGKVAIVERFAQDGASVVVNYPRSAGEARDVVAGIEANGGTAVAIQADTSSVADIRRLFRETIVKFGQVDIVVNNAGAVPSIGPKPIAEVAEELLDWVFALFARGPFFVMQEAARVLPLCAGDPRSAAD